jgi:molybdenum-dependent DNA-binding transcriptional regulator ModE
MTPSDPFATISEEYATVHSVFEKAAGLPSGPAFIGTYGDVFDDAAEVEQMASALSVIDEAAQDLGDPASIRQLLGSHPDALSEPYSKSDTLYVGLLKMASATQNASSTLASALSMLPTILTGDGATIAENVKTALSGWGGAAQSGNRARDAAHDLSARFAALEKKVEPALVTLSGSMLNNLATRNVAAIELLEKDVEEARKAYEDSFFGKGRKKEAYDDLSAKLAEKEPQLNLNTGFIAKVKGLDVAAMEVMPALQRLSNCLAGIEQRFVDSAANLRSVASAADNSQLSSREWLDKALNLPDAVDAWSKLAQQSQDFVQNSLGGQ